jgi:hypothetical protein
LHATAHRRIDGHIEYLVYARHLLGRTFHVHCAHLLRNGGSLRFCDGSEALSFEELDAGTFVAEIGFEAAEYYGCCWTEVEDFGVPLLSR